MNNQDDMMMQQSLHNLIVEMENVTKAFSGAKDYDRTLEIADKISTILKRFADMGYIPTLSVENPQDVNPKPQKGKEESE